MEPIARKIHVAGMGRIVERRKDLPYAFNSRRRQALGLIVFVESVQTLVTEISQD